MRVQSVVGIIAATLLFVGVTSFAVVASSQYATELLASHEQVIQVPERLPGYAAREEAELDNEEIAQDRLIARKNRGYDGPAQFARANEGAVTAAKAVSQQSHALAHSAVWPAVQHFNKVTMNTIAGGKAASDQNHLAAHQAVWPAVKSFNDNAAQVVENGFLSSQNPATQFHPSDSTEKVVRGAAEHRLKVKTAVATAQGALQTSAAVAEKAVRKQLLSVSIPASQRLVAAGERVSAPSALADAAPAAEEAGAASPAETGGEAAAAAPDDIVAAAPTAPAPAAPKQAPADAGQGKLEGKGVNVKGTSWDLLGNWQGVGSLDDHPADVIVPIAQAKVGEPLVGEPLLESEQEVEGGAAGGAQEKAVAGSQRLAAAPPAAAPGANLLAGAKGMDHFVKMGAATPAASDSVDHSRALELKSPTLALHTLRDKVRKDSPGAQEPLFERIF